MEVHHHSHHPKKWKEYFTEFFMLFAAVTLGFLAENLREVYIEKERSHELILQLKADIRNNIKLIDSVVERDKVLAKEFDTAVVYMSTNDLIDGDSLYANIPPNVFRFLSKNDTYDQMKSSASLRYIKDSILLDKILTYASDCAAAEARSSSMEVDFVAGEYTNVIDKWMPKTIAANRLYRERSGIAVIVNRETTSKLLIDESTTNFLSVLNQMKKEGKYNKTKSDEIRASLIPTLSRRSALLINTVRFMGVAKQSGLSLLEYIEKQEH
jgi:hypothetical protein